jgi:hypothetical protein
MSNYQKQVDDFMTYVESKNPAQNEFIQAVREVVESLIPYPALFIRLALCSW